jgi:hypothetical protein
MRKPRTKEIISGRVAGNGDITGGYGLFSVFRNSAGVYTVTCPPNFRVINAVANPNVAASAFIACTDYGGNTFVVRCYAWNTAATAGDCPFNFIATGW